MCAKKRNYNQLLIFSVLSFIKNNKLPYHYSNM